MTYLVITLPRGDEDLLTQLFLAEKRMGESSTRWPRKVFDMTFEVRDGKTYRIWHTGDGSSQGDYHEDWKKQIISHIPSKLEWKWATENPKKEPFEDF